MSHLLWSSPLSYGGWSVHIAPSQASLKDSFCGIVDFKSACFFLFCFMLLMQISNSYMTTLQSAKWRWCLCAVCMYEKDLHSMEMVAWCWSGSPRKLDPGNGDYCSTLRCCKSLHRRELLKAETSSMIFVTDFLLYIECRTFLSHQWVGLELGLSLWI